MSSLPRYAIFAASVLFTILPALVVRVHAVEPKEVNSIGYDHDRFKTQPVEIFRNYGAYVLSFDSRDDDDGDGEPDMWGIPVWVAHEVKRFEGRCIETSSRPKWFTDRRLAVQGIAPRDSSYKFSRIWRKLHPDWYVRGHMAMKLLAERMGPNAAFNTHIVLNAVPQRQSFNAGIWLDLELLTGAWAQRFSSVWIMTGPIIIDGKPSGRMGDEREFQIAIPEALFKIVAKDSEILGHPPDVLAFIYPQVGPGYTNSNNFRHERYLVSVDEIEELTNLDFFTALPDSIENDVESKRASALWTADDSDFISACRS